MLKAEGSCRIDGVAVGEVTINLLEPSVQLAAKFAYVDHKSQERLGFSNRSLWSDRTMEKLLELIKSMEEDICEDIFTGTPSHGSGQSVEATSDGVPGL